MRRPPGAAARPARRPAPAGPPDAAADLLRAWAMNDRVNLALLRAIPAEGLAARPTGSKGRTVGQAFAHLHTVRVVWLGLNGARFARDLPRFAKGASPSRRELAGALQASGAAVTTLFEEALAGRHRLHSFRGSVARMLAYLVSHDAHHRGQIALALKQGGLKLPLNVAIGALWQDWCFGKP